MNYKHYQKSRDKAWQILIDYNIRELPISVSALCDRMGIVLRLYEPTDGNDGCCGIRLGKPRIYVNKNCSPERRRFTTAHEIGHIVCGHVGKHELVNREPSPDDNPIEQQANVFAARLLAPACVLWGCGVQTADDIQRLCGISRQAAEYRMERMKILYARNKFLISPLERQVYAQFAEYIEKNKISPSISPAYPLR
ncbi:MAG: ImmA/IrrE family metallo-endopeptidase [Clostridia bacterium]|nr:ImmA/IrrE family metallo-endopeptidase [Clostridia bacterium]